MTKEKEFKKEIKVLKWLAEKYPDVYAEYMLTCPCCGRKFINAIDITTGKANKYLWKPDCNCLGDLMLSRG